MNQQEFLLLLQSRGLRSWQANFVVSFLETDSAAFHLLAAPPGTGKSYTSIAIAAELASRGARRMLVLPPASLCEEWRERLGSAQSELPVVFVTRQVFREMEAAVPIGESPLNVDGIYVIGQDLAKQSDLAASLSAANWDLVIVDEAHRLASPQRAALLDRVVAADVVRRLLLLTATPLPMLEPWLRPSPDQPARLPSPLVLTNWYGVLKDWDGSNVDRQRVEWSVVSYSRNSDEVKFLSGLLVLMPTLKSGGDGTSVLTQVLIRRRAGSSLFAVEQSLQRLRSNLEVRMRLDGKVEQVEQDLGPVCHIENSTVEGTAAIGDETSTAQTEPDSDIEEVAATTLLLPVEWADLPAAVAVVEQCLDVLDCVSADEKLNALKGLIQSIIESQIGSVPKICVFSMYADTVSYLHTAMEDVGLPLFKLTGGSSFTERQATVELFLREGGLILGTDGALSEGISLPQVAHVVHYDLPSNPLILAKRCGRFDRFGRTGPLTMYVLKDESGVLAFESRLIERVALNRDLDADVMDENSPTT
ncbi:MAG: DEAD/DEAH box helicase [Planctomycetia bacterium]|nr:DEAD/DEAH box helicase [Planctomycetia bacterium]